jgi:hypothetical protein
MMTNGRPVGIGAECLGEVLQTRIHPRWYIEHAGRKAWRNTVAITNALASVAVKDLAISIEWYQRLFGRLADSAREVAEWSFERGGLLQVYQLKERAGWGSVTLAVSSLDEQIANLHKIGIDPGDPMISETVKVVMIKDPDGNSIAFAETIDPSVAH